MMMTQLASPVTTVVPVRDFADHLRMGTGFADDGREDAVLEMYLCAAATAVEARIGKALITRRLAWDLTAWQTGNAQGLPVAPITAIESVTITRGDATVVEVDPGRYRLQADAHRPRLVAYGGCLPSIPDGGQVRIVFDAGFGAASADVPADLRQAVLLLAADFYENRLGHAGKTGALPFAVLALLEPHRAVRL